MISLPNPQAATDWCNQQRARGQSVGYVATMGALHEGHLSLVARAAKENDCTCASIFVNPLQFNNRDDLTNYPRDEARDKDLLTRAGCDMLYTGTLADFFPEVADLNDIPRPDPGDVARGLEGDYRPGHLSGVRAIVERLFQTVGECTAYFGEKDFQQTLVVKNLANKMSGINIVVCPTVREVSGIAMSSRNQRLTDAQLKPAAKIFQALTAVKQSWEVGIRTAVELEAVMVEVLADPDLTPEYVAVRNPNAWTANSPSGELSSAQALIAVQVGGVRLIDTMRLDDGD